MRNFGRRILLLVLWATSAAGIAQATERQIYSTVRLVYPQADGSFVVGIDTPSPYCNSTYANPQYLFVAVGQFNVTAEGAEKIYAAALTAMTTGLAVVAAFDDSTSYCYVNRLYVTN